MWGGIKQLFYMVTLQPSLLGIAPVLAGVIFFGVSQYQAATKDSDVIVDVISTIDDETISVTLSNEGTGDARILEVSLEQPVDCPRDTRGCGSIEQRLRPSEYPFVLEAGHSKQIEIHQPTRCISYKVYGWSPAQDYSLCATLQGVPTVLAETGRVWRPGELFPRPRGLRHGDTPSICGLRVISAAPMGKHTVRAMRVEFPCIPAKRSLSKPSVVPAEPS